LTPGDLLRLSRTSREHSCLIKEFVSTKYSVDTHLSRFFPGTLYPSFRSLQARTGLVIFGAVALDFFTRTIDTNAVLDLMVENYFSVDAAIWLKTRGFLLLDDKDEDDGISHFDDIPPGASDSYGSNSDSQDLTPEIEKYSNGAFTIHLWIARHTTLEKVLGSNLTCTMNFITANEAVCLYPQSTLQDGISL
ncbi:hypothetical protein BDN72DRAFT_741595, partial [Pluteus cervinus]